MEKIKYFISKYNILCTIGGGAFAVAAYCIILPIMGGYFAFEPELMILPTCFIFLGLSFISIAVINEIQVTREEKKKTAEANKKKSDEKKAHEQLISRLASEEWFPEEEFYNICKKNNVSDFDDVFYQKKACQLAYVVLGEYGISENECKNLITIEKLRRHYDVIDAENERKNKAKQEKEELRRITPVAAKLNSELKVIRKKHLEASKRQGIEKRKYILQTELTRVVDEINELEEAQKAALQLGVLVASSSYQQKEKDWALIGGIADGLAGPGAGVAAAAKAMFDNVQIVAENEANRKWAAQQAFELSSLSLSANDKIKHYKKHLEQVREDLENVGGKVVLDDVSFIELEKALTTKVEVLNKESEGFVKGKLHIFNEYKPNVPESVKMCVDGCYTATLREGDILVSSVDVSLPTYGVACKGGLETVDFVFDKYLPGDNHNYTCTVKPKTLWAMEI